MKFNIICKLFHKVKSEEVGGFYNDEAIEYTCETCGNWWSVDKDWRY